jgi:signal transduction histidine kinase
MDIEGHSFFRLFEAETAAKLLKLTETRVFPNKTVLFSEGDPPEFIYLVIRGRVDLDKETSPGTFMPIAVLEADTYFGEFGVIDGTGRSARAITRTELHAAVIPRDAFIQFMMGSPGCVSIRVMRHIIDNVRNIDRLWLEEVMRKEKISMVGEMANSILHDIKGSLTIIQMAAELMNDVHDDEETIEYCGIITNQIDRMQSMAQEVLNFSRGDANLDRAPANVRLLLEKFRQSNDDFARQAGVALTIDVPDLVIEIDSHKIERALQNLFRNAVESMETKGGEIRISAQEFPDYIEIALRDNGPGIPEEIQERLFEPFVSHGKQGGTGLGMSITKSVIDAHQGRLSFETGPDGTTFYLHLPKANVINRLRSADTVTV